MEHPAKHIFWARLTGISTAIIATLLLAATAYGFAQYHRASHAVKTAYVSTYEPADTSEHRSKAYDACMNDDAKTAEDCSGL